jgi:hypothetical protein
MDAALPEAITRIAGGGQLVLLTSAASAPADGETVPLPGSQSTILYLQTTLGNPLT